MRRGESKCGGREKPELPAAVIKRLGLAEPTMPTRSSVLGEVTRGVSSLLHDASAVAFAESAAQHIVIAVENQPTR
jgi:hypothetical protein